MDVEKQELLLAYLGYYTLRRQSDGNLAIDKIKGPALTSAIRCFQKDHGLQQTGEMNAETERAVKAAVPNEAPGEEIIPPAPPKIGPGGVDWSKYPHFTPDEMQCRCGGRFCNGWPADLDPNLMGALEQTREHFGGKTISVSSGERDPQYNLLPEVGGVRNSRHTIGHAVDFHVNGANFWEVLDYVRSLPQIKFAYAIKYKGNYTGYIHMDTGV